MSLWLPLRMVSNYSTIACLDTGTIRCKVGCMGESLQYLTNESGEKTAVVLPLSDYEKLMEDLEDLAVVAERRDEPTLSHEQFKTELKRDGLL
jgi:hypothetical protein